MKSNDIAGLSPIWLLCLALVLGVAVIVAIPVALTALDGQAWLSFSGSVLSGACAILAVAAATHNVTRQMQTNVFSREEDRIEKELPQIEDIGATLSSFISFMSSTSDNASRLAIIERTFGTVSQESLERRFPDASANMLKNLASDLTHLSATLTESIQRAPSLERARKFLAGASTPEKIRIERQHYDGIALQADILNLAIKNRLISLASLERRLRERIDILRKRKQQCRSALEKFFDNRRNIA